MSDEDVMRLATELTEWEDSSELAKEFAERIFREFVKPAILVERERCASMLEQAPGSITDRQELAARMRCA